MEQVPAFAGDLCVAGAASWCQTLLIPRWPCVSTGPRCPIRWVLGGRRHRRHPPRPPWGCAWAPGCCSACGTASTSCSAAGASGSCWTREQPPPLRRRTPSTPCLPLCRGIACCPVPRELTDPQRWDPTPACAPPDHRPQ